MADAIQCANCGVRFPPQNDHQGKMVVCPQCRRPTRNEPAGPSPAAANPYGSPEAATASPLVADTRQGSPVDSPEIYRALAGTRPWALFVGISGFVASGIGALSMIRMAILENLRGQDWPRCCAAFVVAVLVALGWSSLLYGRRIGLFLKTQDLHDLERALLCQRALWRLAGTMFGVVVAIIVVVALVLAG